MHQIVHCSGSRAPNHSTDAFQVPRLLQRLVAPASAQFQRPRAPAGRQRVVLALGSRLLRSWGCCAVLTGHPSPASTNVLHTLTSVTLQAIPSAASGPAPSQDLQAYYFPPWFSLTLVCHQSTCASARSSLLLLSRRQPQLQLRPLPASVCRHLRRTYLTPYRTWHPASLCTHKHPPAQTQKTRTRAD
ncbi:hypothetical protein HDV57DRAFT_101754 [Trichoderma longibrachiatum]|uniref:Uncharacterized protein n=1 Tax=Trichoderma longibrachiatum ATCC 18648 TaxID=983965 RepID=A0A2T4BSL5_TRILO|nr:hypothetical protein M440DRAFT_1096122 [Trichoderma longibrachiatum ATCC 18648]